MIYLKKYTPAFEDYCCCFEFTGFYQIEDTLYKHLDKKSLIFESLSTEGGVGYPLKDYYPAR